MPTQKVWSYEDAFENFHRPLNMYNRAPGVFDALNTLPTGEGGAVGMTPFINAKEGRSHIGGTWRDTLQGNAYERFGPSAWTMSDAELEQIARQHGILGARENSFGEDFGELAQALAIPGAYFGAGYLTDAFAGLGGVSGGAAGAGTQGAALGSGINAGASTSGSLYTSPFTSGANMGLSAAAPSMNAAVGGLGGGIGSAGGFAGAGAAGAAGAGALSPGFFGAESLGTPVAPASTYSVGMGTQVAAPTATKGLMGVLGNPQVLGAAAGAALGGLGGGSEPAGMVTTTQDVPDWLKGYMKPALDRYATEFQNYQVDPYGVMPAAMQEYKNTISGMYLDPSTNKYLEDYYRLGAERVKGTLSPSFGHMQAFGSHSGYNEALSRGLGDLATGIYGQAYEKERDRQAQLTAAAPNYLQSYSQASFAPYQNYLSTFGSLGKQTSQPYFEPNKLQQMLSGGMLGYGLGSVFK